MKITAYFFDNYTGESIWIAAMLWPIFFVPFYMFYKDGINKTTTLVFSAIASLIMASFCCLIFADSLVEYITFFLGVSLLVFGSMAMMNRGKSASGSCSAWIVGVLASLLAAIIVYAMRRYVYNRKTSPTTPGQIKTLLTPGAWIWIAIQAALYACVVYLLIR